MLMPILNPVTVTDFDQNRDQGELVLLLSTRNWLDPLLERGEWTVPT